MKRNIDENTRLFESSIILTFETQILPLSGYEKLLKAPMFGNFFGTYSNKMSFPELFSMLSGPFRSSILNSSTPIEVSEISVHHSKRIVNS